ncbi:peptidyl-prolyl cis-trans isomerase [Pseudalkalibacillus decolorationis]|uniref:peptidyl-prolyl cis-trans isomerase n=1 Tax=Pseudalkalibacillus decolorationis TaxID=163879 RepID=UPI00214726FA|nr:peptidyl-prolyl cis-trans isomerase [Pseudalkalibacillus decolorationis]
MESIVFIDGKVRFPITLDPGVWIFDDRKLNLDTYFEEGTEDESDTYTKDVSEHWDRERTEGAEIPSQTNDNKIKYDKSELFSRSYGIQLNHFLINAEPDKNATQVLIQTTDGQEFSISITEAFNGVIGFSTNGKPVNNGPVHFYYGDGSNRNEPICSIKRFTLN